MNRYVAEGQLHGSHSTYCNHRCRCEPCSLAAREYRRAHPLKFANRPSIPEGVVDGKLAVTCWCEADIVMVPTEVLARGETGSCSSPLCRPLAGVS